MLDWTAEQQTLLYTKQIISEVWRMNRSQAGRYCEKLRKNQPEILPGQLGSAFLKILEQIFEEDTDSVTKIWPVLLRDAERLLKLIQEHQNLSREAWLAVLPKLEAQQDRFFETELGRGFILALKEKMNLAVSGKDSEKETAASLNSKKELEQIAVWLMQDPDRHSLQTNDRFQINGLQTNGHRLQAIEHSLQANGHRLQAIERSLQANGHRLQAGEYRLQTIEHSLQSGRRHIWCPEQIKSAAIPVFACLSACCMAVWLYGQIVRNQNEWSAQQMKVSAFQETDFFLGQNPETGPDAINEAGNLADKDLTAENIQVQNAGQADLSVEKTLAKDGLHAGSKTEKMAVDKVKNEKRPQVLEQYQEMAKEYPGLYGWLQIPDTQINLPVMQPFKEKDYYLDHDFTGAESAEGALFTDPQNRCWPQDGNTVIYGHNMKSGHMFGALDMYENAEFFQAHREIRFDTIYETGVYEAVAVIRTRILNENEQGFRYYQFFRYDSEDEFQKCLHFVTENQLFETGSSLQYGDKILMLSTCEYSQENGRLVVVARKTGEN